MFSQLEKYQLHIQLEKSNFQNDVFIIFQVSYHMIEYMFVLAIKET